MGKGVRVSIIIALYNSAAFLDDTVSSVIAQTFPDWELILVDDCSTDDTAERAASWVARDKRIAYTCHQTNRGRPAFGRNTGLAMATGEYVTFLDHDDAFHAEKLERMLSEMNKQQVDFLCSNIELVNATTGNIDGVAWGKVTGDVRNGFAKRLLQGNFVPPNSTLIRKSVFDLVGNFDTNLVGVDDYDMWYRIVRVAPAGILSMPLARWRYRNAESVSADEQKMIIDERHFYEKILHSPRAFPGSDPRGEWQDWEREIALQGVRRADLHIANHLLLAGQYEASSVQYALAHAHHYAKLARRVGPLFRPAYKLKRRLGANSAFKPLELIFPT